MGRIRIQVAADGSLAEAIAAPGPACPVDDLRALLVRAGVSFGVDEPALQQFAQRVADPGFEGAIVLAQGRPASAGVDGRVECDLDLRLAPGRQHADGHIDFHERDRLHPVAAGQVVGRIVPPTHGTAGSDVRGRRLDAKPVREHTMRLGGGVRVDGDTIVAVRGGVLLRDERQFDVVPLYGHAGDVDLRSGNLHTEGSLEIRGDVHEGFAATAEGDVCIGGTVQGGTVQAGGSVQVALGVLGSSAAIQAGGAITCRHATSARLQAGAAVEVGDHLSQCTVSGERIHVQRGRGAVVGGELRARQAIRILTAGAEAGAPTLLAVGDVTSERAELVRRTNSGTHAERNAVRSQRDAGRPGGKAQRAAVRTADATRDEQLRLLQRQRELLRSACIEVAGTVHAGVLVRFGAFTRQLEEPRTRIRFQWDPEQNDIHEEPMP